MNTNNQLAQEYWYQKLKKHQFEGLPATVYGHGRSDANAYCCHIPFPLSLVSKLKEVSKNNPASEFIIQLAALVGLMNKYNVVKTLVSTFDLKVRASEYSNHLLFFSQSTEDEKTFKQLIEELKEQFKEALHFKDYDFNQLVDTLQVNDVLENQDLYQLGFGYEPLNVLPEELYQRFKVLFLIVVENDALVLKIHYNPKFYSSGFINQLGGHFCEALKNLLWNVDSNIDALNVVSEEEQSKLLYEFNSTSTAYPKTNTIQELFEQQASETPSSTALDFEGQRLTYQALNEQANQLAHYLKESYHIKAGDVVGVLLERSERMIIGLLGILKAGAVYLPVNPGYPEERIAQMLAATRVKVLMTDSGELLKITDYYAGALIALDIELPLLTTSKENPELVNTARDLAYIMYTSGSTGMPKGVCIEHRSVIRLVKNTNYISFTQTTKLLQTGALSFDATTFEIWGTLLNGGELYLLPYEKLLDITSLKSKINRAGINTIWFTAPWFNQLVDTDLSVIEKLECVVVGGDKLSVPHINKTRRAYPKLKIVNGYGPTENTTFSICHEIKDLYEENIPIGKPIANSTAYILNAQKRPVPVGVIGDIYLGGDGLARGYWDNEVLTKEKFIQKPWSQDVEDRIYYTGDLGRWMDDGTIEFAGRKDNQVKVRGFRIELGEIENTLAGNEEIKSVLVIARDKAEGDKEIIAYYISQSGNQILGLPEFLSKLLPAYMVPVHFILLDSFPLTVNGKVDYKALPNPDHINTDEYVEAKTRLERSLQEIWKEVLKQDSISIKSNFFSAGGDSIKAIRLVSLINKTLELNIEVKDVFNHQTIDALAAYIESEDNSQEQESFKKAKSEIEAIKYKILNDEKALSLLPTGWEDFYPMSDIQVGMVFHNLLDTTAGTYQDQIFYQISDLTFDVKLFEQALKLLIGKHSILRASFNLSDFDQPLQIIHASFSVNPDIGFESLCHLNVNAQKSYLQDYLLTDRRQSFEIGSPGLFRMRVFQLSESDYLILWIFHHAIMDGWSNASFITELGNVYFELKSNTDFHPQPLKANYKDYIIDQLRYKRSDGIRKYWKEHLADYQRTSLPLHKSYNPGIHSKITKAYNLHLSSETSRDIQALAREQQVSVKDVFLAAFIYLLKVTTDTDDVTIGVVTHGRPGIEDGDKIIGCFLNTIPFRVKDIPVNTQGSLWIKKVSNLSHHSKAYDKLSLMEIVKALGEENESQNPLFDIIFNYMDFHIADEIHEELAIRESLIEGHAITNTAFDFHISKTGEEIGLSIYYNEDLYQTEELDRISNYYINILKSFTDREDNLFYNEVFGEKEKLKLLNEYNNTYSACRTDKVLHELFEEQVIKTQNNAALLVDDKVFTYKQVNDIANKIANYLRENFKVLPEDLVGIMTDRSEWMIIGILGILKSGAAYVPIDPKYPEERIAYILNDSGVKLVLSQKQFSEFLKDITWIELTYESPVFEQYSPSNPSKTNTPGNLAYLIYTSGSTGHPKGVEILHSNAVALIDWAQTEFANSNFETLLAVTSYCFDLSIYEFFYPLSIGKQIRLLESGLSIKNYLHNSGKILINTVPSVVGELVKEGADFSQVSVLNMAGEPIPLTLKRALDCERIEIRNLYGPSEDTTYSSCYRFSHHHNIIPVGKPVSNTFFYILGKDLQLLPEGAVGEICISGKGLARGYRNRKELTEEKFVKNPFLSGERLYRTGDLGRWLPDGNIEYLGRKDSQIKLRGYRIELGEIENRLIKYEGIEHACVLLKEDQQGEKQLIAYFISSDNKNIAQLRQYLKNCLPEYMIPSCFIPMDAFPLSPNGKIDKKALPSPKENLSESTSEYLASQTFLEEKIVKIWSEVLGIERLGIRDNFFELGGHSVKATRVVSRVSKELNIKFDLKNIFINPTVESFAKAIDEAEKVVEYNIEPVGKQEYYELSHAQKQLWILDFLNDKLTAYNMPRAFVFKGSLDIVAFESAFDALISRHESLRTTFVTIEDKPRQKINEPGSSGFKLDYLDLRNDENREKIASVYANQEAAHVFDLQNGPLIRAKLIQMEDEKYVFLLTLHHIISDAWSMEVIVNDTLNLYSAYKSGKENPLSELKIQYKDYAAWQNKQLREEKLKEHQKFWKEQFADEIPVLRLPTDFSRPALKTYDGHSLQFTSDKQALVRLKQLSQEKGVSLFMTLLASTKALLYRYTNQKDIVVGSPISGRDHEILENQIGVFINSLALRTRLDDDETFETLLSKVKENTLLVYQHQVYPFDCLVADLDFGRDKSHSPFFDVIVSLQNTEYEDTTLEMEGISVTSYEHELEVSAYDLMINMKETHSGLLINIIYNTNLFKEDTIRHLASGFLDLIEQVTEEPSLKLDMINLSTVSNQDYAGNEVDEDFFNHNYF